MTEPALTDEELAAELLKREPPPKWFWTYTVEPRHRTDELHLFPPDLIPVDKIGAPSVAIPEDKRPLCWKEREVQLPKDMAHRMVFNVGGADVLRLIRVAGNTVDKCPVCVRIELELAKGGV